ncbi:MAG: DUF2089 family protein [Bacteroidales bacterium]|nr:DUF2089 family protein [Bacteroidales bacterium]MDD3166154.1 DUF2089 family protein [Bacteroidales bacterium]MDD4771213.1 DUF2089 family protein [Bacteroidales bacterium]
MLPTQCPSCQEQLNVTCLKCAHCGTEVHGVYDLPLLARLTEADQQFVLRFVKSSGSLKEMATQMKLSYPTVRNLLNEIIQKINDDEK